MNDDILQKKFDSLPADIKAAITSTDVAQKLTDIGQKHQLHLDQVETLEEEVTLAMLGVTSLDDFVDRVEEKLNVDSDMAIDIATDVNEEVLLSIRESIQKIQLSQEENEAPEEVPNAEREQILSDIENPRPTAERGATPITNPEREIAARSATDSFVADKLSAPSISVGKTETVKVPQSPEAPGTHPPAGEAGKKYSADPYREPIN